MGTTYSSCFSINCTTDTTDNNDLTGIVSKLGGLDDRTHRTVDLGGSDDIPEAKEAYNSHASMDTNLGSPEGDLEYKTSPDSNSQQSVMSTISPTKDRPSSKR